MKHDVQMVNGFWFYTQQNCKNFQSDWWFHSAIANQSDGWFHFKVMDDLIFYWLFGTYFGSGFTEANKDNECIEWK